MPLVVVTANPSVIKIDTDFQLRIEMLREIVAEHLSSAEDNALLTQEEIEVRVRVPGPHDLGFPNLGVEVFANSYPSREQNIQDRTDAIARDVQKLFDPNRKMISGNASSFVWVFLGVAGFSSL